MATPIIETQSQTRDQLVLADKPKAYKGITVKSGEGSLSRGQLLAQGRSDDKYLALGTIAAVSSESAGVTPADNTEVIIFDTANKPLLPGTFTMTCTVSSGLATVSDDREGHLIESSNKLFGDIDYGKGVGKLHAYPNKFMDADNTFTMNYSHFGNAGEVDIKELAVLLEDLDATSADKDTVALQEGSVDYEGLTPTVTYTSEDQKKFFRNAGLRIEKLN